MTLEVYIERWVKSGHASHPWSVWEHGAQVHASHGVGTYDDPDEAERDAVVFCRTMLKSEPDEISRL